MAGAVAIASTASARPATSTTNPVTLPAPVPPVRAPPDNCVKGQWPSIIEGRPGSFQASAEGVYLWHDPNGGWALRVTHVGAHGGDIFSGALTTGGQFVDVRRAQGEQDDIVIVSPDKHTILFRFVNFGRVDGIDFTTRCALGFATSIYIGGQIAPTASIHLGGTESQPTSNPFMTERLRR
ncbi:MAG: hypothetical protein ABSE77_10620 [Acidimicrobiales bacterium]